MSHCKRIANLVFVALFAGALLFSPAAPGQTAAAFAVEDSPVQSDGVLPGAPAATGSADLLPAGIYPLMAENFETAFPSGLWTVYDADLANGVHHWGVSTFNPHAGLYSAWVAAAGADGALLVPGTDPYPVNADSWMVYGPFSLVGALDAELSFWYWNQSEAGVDIFRWMASTDGTNFYGDSTSGDSGGWQQVAFDLTAVPTLGDLRGEAEVWIAFQFTSNEAIGGTGPFVDDVSLILDLLPDLAPFTRSGWSAPVVPSSVTGTTITGTLYSNLPTYVDWTVGNAGGATSSPLVTCLYLDDVEVNCWTRNASLSANSSGSIIDFEIDSPPAGLHTLRLVTDVGNTIVESDETNNTWEGDFYWNAPCYSLAVNPNPDYAGDVTVTAPNCGGLYTEGTSVTLTPVANNGYIFNNWSGDLTGSANPLTFTINANTAVTANFYNRAPTLTSLNPSTATAGSGLFTLTLNGTNFVQDSVARWNNTALTTTYVSSTQLTASVPAANITTAGTANVTVFNPTPGGGTSTAATFTINNPSPLVSGLNPTSVIAGASGFTLTVNGSSFVPTSVVRWNGSDLATTYVSAGQLTATVEAANVASAGTANVTVFNPTPGGGTSSAQTFTINNPTPAVTGISPTSATAGGSGFTLTVNGSNFVATSVVRWNDAALTTTFVNAGQLTAAVPAANIASGGTANVTVFNPTPGGGTSSAQTFTINNPAPAITGLSPSSVEAGGSSFTLTVNGSNFVGTSVVRWNGTGVTTTFVNSGQLTITVPASEITTIGTASVTVFNPTPGGGTSNAVTLAITKPAPVLTSIAPDNVVVGAAGFTLTVTGSAFDPGMVVRWNGANLVTTYVNSTTLTADVPAANVAAAGTASVTVHDPSPDGGTSTEQVFTINNPTPVLTKANPKLFLMNGAAAQITVTGSSFINGAVVLWDGVALTTTYVNATTLTAVVPAGSLTTAGPVQVSVRNPAPAVDESNELEVLVVDLAIRIPIIKR